MSVKCLSAAALLCAAIVTASCGGGKDVYTKLNRQAAQEYLQPVRPASEGRNPCWNKYAKKFMYAPTFDVPAVPDALAYRFTVRGEEGSWSFTADAPDVSLAPIWNDIPPSAVKLTVEAKLPGDRYDTVFTRSFLRDFPFKGPYHEAVRDYREAAILGALYVHLTPEIQHWIGSDEPDMAYSHNTYPCKIIGATIRNECLIARELPERRENALEIARSAAAFLMRMSRPADEPLAYFPPTYYLDRETSNRDYNRGKTMMLEAASAGQAFLDLYDATGEPVYLERAVAIGRTYVKLQRPDGSLPIKVDFLTGEPVNDVCAMLHPLLRYFQRLEGYGYDEFVPAREKGERWMDEVAVERFDMTGQFEDVSVVGLEPYQNLTNVTATRYASYLLNKPTVSEHDLQNARDLIRLSEDQFAHWAYHELTPDGFHKKNAPGVHEQYKYEMPVNSSSCNLANAWLDYYEVTGDLLSYAKAKALIDNITIQQNAVSGMIPTSFEWREPERDRRRTFWVNCTLNSVTTLLRFAGMSHELPGGASSTGAQR